MSYCIDTTNVQLKSIPPAISMNEIKDFSTFYESITLDDSTSINPFSFEFTRKKLKLRLKKQVMTQMNQNERIFDWIKDKIVLFFAMFGAQSLK